jgi:glucosamine--fructose-6-phosphate aminotransferase (isomerizing)
MCGIVGFVGKRDALPVLLSGLEKLEYRGYDSAGVTLWEDGKLRVTRALGKLAELKKALLERAPNPKATLGIGHTRWATHGKPSEINAHPHTAGRVSLVHNGIIENYLELRAELVAQGRTFVSETDTEIAAHLLDRELSSGKQPLQALSAVCRSIRGSYAFVALDAEHPDRVLVAKQASPLIIGVGSGEMFVASDIPALLEYTRDIIILEEGDIAEVTAQGAHIENQGVRVQREPVRISWDPVTAQKGGFKHFMLKEIHEQPRVIAESSRGRMAPQSGQVLLPELDLSPESVRALKRIVLVACGSAWHTCLVAKFFIEQFARIPCEVDYGSEFRYRNLQEHSSAADAGPLLDRECLLIAVSQSGETADTLAAVDRARGSCTTLALCNVLGSSLSRRADQVLFTHAGPEISVASTKAFTSQLVSFYLLAIWLGQQRDCLSNQRVHQLLTNLSRLPTAVEEVFALQEQLEACAKQLSKARDILFLGRGSCFPIALEGALKMKEISYIHAEGYPAGEMKHGPIALIDQAVPVVVLLPRSPILLEKTLSNLKEVEARGGKIVAISDASLDLPLMRQLSEHCHKDPAAALFNIPYISDELSPLVMTIPLQLLAYYVAVAKGTDVDLPRNLAKSVTVE